MRFKYKKIFRSRILVLIVILGLFSTYLTPSLAFAEDTTQDSGIAKAIDWLQQNQQANGSWGVDDTAFVVTSEVAGYLEDNNLLPDNLQKSVAWSENLNVLNNDMGARILPLIKNTDKHNSAKNTLLASQNQDGGWGLAKGYQSDILDTTLVLNSLTANANTDTSILQKAVSYIISKQHTDGSWSFNGNSDSNISLTAQVALALSTFQAKTNLTSSDLQTATRRAGENLVSIQKADKTWGLDEESIVGTLLSYRAVLNTVDLNAVDTVDTAILSVQQSDGSWFGSPFITALAIKALKERQDMPTAKINSIKLFKDDNGTSTECYSYNAYEMFSIQVDSTYSPTDAKLLYFIKQKDGTVISAETDGQPGWNTRNSLPGDYAVIVQVKDNSTGRIIASSEKKFVINPTFNIANTMISTDPLNTRVNNPVTVNMDVILVTESNIDKTLDLKLSIYDGSIVVSTDTKSVECKATEQINIVKLAPFTPDVVSAKDYSIQAEVFDGTAKISEGNSIFKVLPPAPPTRIDAAQSLDKTLVNPGTDSVTATFKLNGVGTPEMPQRKPIDLVLAIDDSGSMEWGNIDYSTTRPWRIDFAKDASKQVIDLLQSQDRGAVVEFAGSIWTQQDLTGDKELLKTRISQTPSSPWNGTAIGSGLQRAISILDSKSSVNNDKVIVLLSDGGENVWSSSSVVNQAIIANQKGYKIYTIGLGAGADQNLLRTLANTAQGQYVFSPTMEQLNEMMSILAGEIFDTAGKNVSLETTIPVSAMTVDTTKLGPAPTGIVTNADNSKTLTWTLDKLIMGQEKDYAIKYDGTNLVSDTTVLLTKNTKLTYQDKNGTTVTDNLPDLQIPVNKYMLDSTVATDKSSYTANENVTITNTAKNLTSAASTLSGRVDIVDANGSLVGNVAKDISNNWAAGESKSLSFTWNTAQTMSGSYKARVTWSEGDKVISVAECGFNVTADAGVAGTVTTDKQKYTADQDVNINETLTNSSTNSIQNALTVKTFVKSAEGTTLGSNDNPVAELLPGAKTSVKNSWNTAKNVPGQYTVVVEVYDGSTMLTQNSTTFEIVSEDTDQGVSGVSGSLQVLQKEIFPADDVGFQYTMNNTGNVKLTDVTARIRIVDTATEEVLGTITDKTSIDVSASYTAEKTWTHAPLPTGAYMVVLDAVLSGGQEVSLGSGYIKVEKPFTTTISQVVRPRVLVWAESQANIELAKKTLDEMQVYYKTVNNRDDFMTELRTGKYNLYMLLDSKLPLQGNDDQELAAEIEKGQGIIASRDADGDNLKNLGLFGVKYKGQTTPHDFTVDFPADSPFGKLQLTGSGKAQYVQLQEGQQLAVLNSKKGASPGVVFNEYQSGKAILFTFDLGSCTGDTMKILNKAVELAAPKSDTDNGYAELEVKVQANTAIGALLKVSMPQGAELVWTDPAIKTPEMTWSFDTATGTEYTLRMLVKLPQSSESNDFTIESSYQTKAGTQKFEENKISITGK